LENREYEVNRDNLDFFKSLISNNDVYLFNVVENDEEESTIKKLLESNNVFSLGLDPYVPKSPLVTLPETIVLFNSYWESPYVPTDRPPCVYRS
jgi:hypothetical protein